MKWLISLIISLSVPFSLVHGQIVETQAPISAESEVDVPLKVEKTDTAVKAENEIPLNLESKKGPAASESPFYKFILFFSILGILLTGAWILLKKFNTKNISRNQNEIKVLAQHFLGPKKSLVVVRVAGESILIGVTENNINLIKALSLLDEELPEVTPGNFKELINAEEEEFSIKGIKDIVSTKLKNMRSI